METNNKQKEYGFYYIIILSILSTLVSTGFVWSLIKTHSPYLLEAIIIFAATAIFWSYIGMALIVNSYKILLFKKKVNKCYREYHQQEMLSKV